LPDLERGRSWADPPIRAVSGPAGPHGR
jgi:hypothetical protein